MGSASGSQGPDLFGGYPPTEQSARPRTKVLTLSGNGRIVLMMLVLLFASIALVVLAKLLTTNEQPSEQASAQVIESYPIEISPEEMTEPPPTTTTTTATTKCAALRLRPDEDSLTCKKVTSLDAKASARLVGYIDIDAEPTSTVGLYAPLEADALVANATGERMFLELSSACSLTQIYFDRGAEELTAKVKARVQVEGKRWDLHCATDIPLVMLIKTPWQTDYVGRAPRYVYCDQDDFGTKSHTNRSGISISSLQLRIYDINFRA